VTERVSDLTDPRLPRQDVHRVRVDSQRFHLLAVHLTQQAVRLPPTSPLQLITASSHEHNVDLNSKCDRPLAGL
jgi:hypothetical protein